MTTMLERAAIELAKRRSDPKGVMPQAAVMADVARMWENPYTRGDLIHDARAVLLAVREPTSEVAEAGYAVTGYEENCDVSFTAMIDAILAEEPGT